MAIPPDAAPAPIEEPFANPANVTAELPAPGVNAEGYLGGTVDGTILSYPDVADFVWFDLLELPNRIRSTFDVTLGRTLVGTPQADVSSSETVPRAEGARVGDLIPYPTMIRPTVPIALLRAIEDAGGTPVYEQRLVYETRLAALSRMFPPTLYTTVDDALDQPTATAQEVLQYLFDLWTELFPEFRAKPVPPLILFAPDDDGLYTRTLTTDRIYVKQPAERERSIQTLLEDFRAIFVGYGVSVDADGDVVIIPPPWAAGVDRRVIAPLAYRMGPGSWDEPLENIGAVGRVDVTSSPWELEADYAGSQVELRIGLRALLSNLPDGPEEPSLAWVNSGTRATLNVILDPNVEQLVEHDVVSLLSGAKPVLMTVRYAVVWDRPGATGGTVLVTPVDTPTVVGTGIFAPVTGDPGTIVEIVNYVSHSLILTAYSAGAGSGRPARTVTASEIATPVPKPAFDGSRVINRQTARYRDLDFVEDTPLLASLSTRIGATTYTPSGTAHVPPATFQPFVDEDDEPLIIGERIQITFDYQLRRARNSSGNDEQDRDSFYRSETFELRPGATRSFTYRLNGEVPLTSGFLVTIRFMYRVVDGVAGLIVDFPAWAARSSNTLLTRPWFGHVVAWDTTGSVYQETGEELEVTYDETSGVEAVETSQALYGVREGPVIDVNFLRVTYEDLLDVTEAIVRFNMEPRARYTGVELTQASNITPADLNRELLLPWGIAAVLEAYRYDDARAYDSSRTSRRLDLVLLYPLIDSAGAYASDVENAVEETAGIAGASIALDAD